ncbi:MAG: cupredoxin domain-containing protein [Chloroflexota bacterium]
MQATSVTEHEASWLAKIGLAVGILIGLFLFGVVVARMGLLNGMVHGGETAVSLPQDNTIIYTTKAMQFGQHELHIKAGQEITLRLENYDTYAHSFDIDELDIHIQMPANDQVSTQITVAATGTYTIYCGVPGHRAAGMMAYLIVEE